MRRSLFLVLVFGLATGLATGPATAVTPSTVTAPVTAGRQLIAYIDRPDNIHGTSQDGVQLLDRSTGVTSTLVPDVAAFDPALSPDGETLMYAALDTNGDGQGHLYMAPVDGSSAPTQVYTQGCNGGAGRWSPDGSEIAIGTSCGLLVLNAVTDQLIKHAGGDFQYPSFSADGSDILSSDGGDDINSYDLATGVTTVLGSGTQPVASPDGTAIAYQSRYDLDGVRELSVMNSDGSDPHVITAANPDGHDDVTTLAWSADSATLFFGANEVTGDNLATNNDLYAVDRAGHFRITLTATPDVNEDTIATAVASRTVDSRGSAFTAITPVRVLDTRTTLGGTKAPLGAGASRTLTVAGTAGIPTDATAVTVNITAIKPTASTYLTATPAPTGTATAPTTSTLNAAAGQVIANGATIAVGNNGAIRLYNHSGSINAALDITGYYAPASTAAFTAITPVRVLDTRTTLGGAKAPLGAGASRTLTVAGTAGIPTDATAVTVNITAIKPTASTYLTATPAPTGTATAPTTSTLNAAAGQVIANGATIAVGNNGAIRLYNHTGSINAALDITGYYTD